MKNNFKIMALIIILGSIQNSWAWQVRYTHYRQPSTEFAFELPDEIIITNRDLHEIISKQTGIALEDLIIRLGSEKLALDDDIISDYISMGIPVNIFERKR